MYIVVFGTELFAGAMANGLALVNQLDLSVETSKPAGAVIFKLSNKLTADTR